MMLSTVSSNLVGGAVLAAGAPNTTTRMTAAAGEKRPEIRMKDLEKGRPLYNWREPDSPANRLFIKVFATFMEL
jgi:hypothetical protein